MKETLSYSWYTEHFSSFEDAQVLLHGSYIWVFNWPEIPHLGLSTNGHYFSATIQGAQIREDVLKFFRLSVAKSIPIFFVKLKEHLATDWCERIFNLSVLDSDTCLSPIKSALGLESEEIDTLSDLLKTLEKQERIEAYLCNQKDVFILSLGNYSKSEVIEMIQTKMNHVTGK